MNEKLEDICVMKSWAIENKEVDFYCFKCTEKYQKMCGDYFPLSKLCKSCGEEEK